MQQWIQKDVFFFGKDGFKKMLRMTKVTNSEQCCVDFFFSQIVRQIEAPRAKSRLICFLFLLFDPSSPRHSICGGVWFGFVKEL